MLLQQNVEDSFLDIAKLSSGPVVLIIDRGVLDLSVFTTESHWKAVMADLGLTKTLIRDKRYDAVIHMVTAADGAEQFYNTIIKHDNVYESAGDARAKDERLRHAYMGHKKWTMIKNTEVNTF